MTLLGLGIESELSLLSSFVTTRADWPYRWQSCEESILWMVSIAKRRTKLRRDRDVDKMPKEMLIWHKQTLINEKDIKVGLMTDLGSTTSSPTAYTSSPA